MNPSIALLIALSLVPAAAWSEESCSRGWVCVGIDEGEDGVQVYARNLQHFPVTISLRMRGRQLPYRTRRTTTVTVAGGDRAVIKRFESVSGDKYRYDYDWTVGNLGAEHQSDYLYRLPYAGDAAYRVLQGFNSSFSHNGLERYTVDFDMPVRTPVHAARAGRVAMLEERHDIGCWEDGCSRYANYLVILHDDGTTGEYYHLARDGVLVEQGERVARGQLIARSGNTGHTTMPHLHFGVYQATTWGRTQSLPVRFATSRGVLTRPRAGARYRH